jgi:predicted permease
LLVSGRLSREVSREEAAVRLDSVTAQLAEIDSAVNADQSLMVHPLPRLGLSTSPTDDGGLSAVATLLMVMSGLVLLVACSNLANMMLARGTARRRELAVRLALGSSRGRIVRQMLLEGAWLSAAGTGLGLLAGAGLVSLLARSLASASLGVQLTLESWPTATVVALTLTVAAIGTAFFALAPAWSLTRGDASLLHEAKEPAGGLTGRRTTVRRALVVAQLVMSVVLLVLGGLFVRGAVNVTRGDPGFRLEGGLMATLDPTFAGISEGRARDFYVRTLERLRSHPSFERAAIAATVPFGDINEGERVSRPGAAPEGEGRRGISANFNIVSAQYFSALGLPVLLGRDFTPQEETSNAGTPVAILSAPLARRLFGDESPVGQQIRIEPREGQPATPLRTVVGVVPGVRQDVLSAEPDAFVYLPWGQAYRAGMTVHARQRDGRAEAAPGAAEELRRTLREVDASVPVLTLRTLTAHRDANLIVWMMRTLAGLLLGFAGVALLLAAVGTYAVHAFLVARATREIGVRMALGARPADVYRLVLGEAGRLVGLALLLGIGLSLPAGFAAGSVLYLVAPFDPVILVAVCTTLALAGALAAYVPARRAARINPVLALRAE